MHDARCAGHFITQLREHSMSKVIVTFEKNWRGYAAGETAGFDSTVAEGLMEAGYAGEANKDAAQGSTSSAAPKSKGAKGSIGAATATKNAKTPSETTTQPIDQADTTEKP